jgi:hypothetical protein
MHKNEAQFGWERLYCIFHKVLLLQKPVICIKSQRSINQHDDVVSNDLVKLSITYLYEVVKCY